MGRPRTAKTATNTRNGACVTPGTNKQVVSTGARGKDRRPVPVDRLLPDAVKAELRQSVSAATAITSPLIAELDRRLAIATQYGVSRRRLSSYLRRLHAANKRQPDSRGHSTDRSTPSEETWRTAVRSHRRRQATVAAVLDQTFGRLAECKPELWERRAYLMLVGLVYERLATNEQEISTDELVALAKILAENRRAEARLRQDRRPHESSPPTPPSGNGKLPDRFADVVRQVYGATLPTTSD